MEATSLLSVASEQPAPPVDGSERREEVLVQKDPLPISVVAKELAELWVPMAITFVCYFSITIVGQLFAATFSVAVVAGYGLSTMMVNSFAFAAVTGLCGGLDTLISQAYGKDPNHPLISVFAQRGLLCFLVLIIPVCVFFYFAHAWMTALRCADAEVIDVSSHYLRILIVAVPVWTLIEVLGTLLSAVNKTSEFFLGGVVAALWHPIGLYLLLRVANVGYEGLAIGWATTNAIMFVVVCLAASWTRSLYGTYRGWNWKQSVRHWGLLLKLALPSCAITMCEWAAFEVNLMIAARYLDQQSFAALVVCQQLYYAFIPVPVAFQYVLAIKIGNYVGDCSPKTARRCANLGIIVQVVMTLCLAGILAAARRPLTSLFAEHAGVRSVAITTLPFASLLFVFDISLGAFTGILRGVGEQSRAAVCTVVGWWVVGIPLGVILFVHQRELLGPGAFFVGPAVGLAVACFMTSYLVLRHVEYVESDHIAKHFELDEEEQQAAAEAVNEAH